jgi:hypothetical protein
MIARQTIFGLVAWIVLFAAAEFSTLVAAQQASPDVNGGQDRYQIRRRV